jgi:uncharacterized protein YjbI with pentapeptide repeats
MNDPKGRGYRLITDTDETAMGKDNYNKYVYNGALFVDSSFEEADLNGAQFNDCVFTSQQFINTQMNGTTFVNCSFDKETIFINTEINNSNFKNCSFNNVSFGDNTEFMLNIPVTLQKSSISDSTFENCKFSNVNMKNTYLERADFTNCAISFNLTDNLMKESKYYGCVFKSSTIINTNMTKSVFNQCSFNDGNVFTNTNFFDTKWHTCTIGSYNIYEIKIEREKFINCTFGDNVTFFESNFNYCIIESSNQKTDYRFDECHLNGIDIKNNSLNSVYTFVGGTSVIDCQFNESVMGPSGRSSKSKSSGSSLRVYNSYIHNCNFTNNTLTTIIFENFVITKSLFRNVNFKGATSLIKTGVLKNCDFSSASFDKKIVVGERIIDVEKTTFEDADFKKNLPDIIFTNYNPDYTKADFNAFNETNPLLLELEPLTITPSTIINDNYASSITYESIVKLLTPNVKNVKLSISEIVKYNWYGISNLGNTTLDEWNSISEKKLDEMPNIGYVFKCIDIPIQREGEANVYTAHPPCMDVHELSRSLNIENIFTTFKYFRSDIRDNISIMQIHERFAKLLYKLLSIDNSYGNDDAWTNVFKNIETRKVIINHAVFHLEEGISKHPFFERFPDKLLTLILFIEKLPLQIQVLWVQNYINEFITGYGKTIEDFNPQIRGDMGFIASCINGNFEKILLSFRTAIVHFYQAQSPEKETSEEKQQTLISSFIGSVFHDYFETLEDISPTTEGYKKFIYTLSQAKQDIFLPMFDDAEIMALLEEQIGLVGGKGRKNKKTIKNRRNKKTIKNRKNKKTIKNRKNKKTIKNRKNKKTIKK